MLNRVHYRFAQQPVDIDYLPTGDKPNHYILRITGEERFPACSGRSNPCNVEKRETDSQEQDRGGQPDIQIDKSMSGRWLELTYRQK